MNCQLQKPSPFNSVPFCTLPKQCYLSLPLEFLALLGVLPAHILWLRKHAEIQIELSWSGSKAKFVCFLVHVIRPQGLFFFFFNRTFSRLLIFPDLWQSGSCFPFPRCSCSGCLFSISFQMSLLIRFISSAFYPFLNFCIIAFHATIPSLLHYMQMNSRSLPQSFQI